MAAVRNRRTARVAGVSKESKTAPMTMSSQIRHYRKMGMKLLKRPATPYILGGVAVTVLAPMIMRLFRNEDVTTFVRDNVDTIRTRIDGFIHSGEEKLESLNQ